MMRYQRHISLWIGCCLYFSNLASAQHLKLGNHPSQATKSAVLELESPNQGLLLSRVSDTNLINAYHPPDGMIIYFTDGKITAPYGEHSGLYERSNGFWQNVQTLVDTAVDQTQSAIKFTHENGKLVLHLPNATTGLRGVMSTGKQTFNGHKIFKRSITINALHPGSIIFVGNDGSGEADTLSENNGNLFWDNDVARLGLGTNTPLSRLDVQGDFKLGTNGSVVNDIINHTFTTVTPNVINSGAHHVFSIALPAVIAGGRVLVSPAAELPDGIMIAYGYTSNGYVYFKIANVSDVAVNLPQGTIFYITVIQ